MKISSSRRVHQMKEPVEEFVRELQSANNELMVRSSSLLSISWQSELPINHAIYISGCMQEYYESLLQ